MTEEWSDWIEHDGKGCPCVGRVVEAVFDRGSPRVGVAGAEGGRSWDRRFRVKFIQVIRYRIRKPKGLTILEDLVANVDEERELEGLK